MRTLWLTGAFVLPLLCALPDAYGDTTSNSGTAKKASFAARDFFTFHVGPGTSAELAVMSATIKRGHAKSVLAITTTGAYTPASAGSVFSLAVFVNGFNDNLHPFRGWVVRCDDTSYGCVLTGSTWLDLEVAEAAHPGQYIGKPLVVTLEGEVTNALSGLSWASLNVVMEKK